MPDVPVSDKPVTAKTADDINDLFKELDSEKELPEDSKKIREDKQTDKKDEKIGEEEEDEIELAKPEGEEDEELDLTKQDENLDIEAPPRKKEILKKYPDVFKDFPFLEKMMYRDRQYTELFGSFDDAKEVAERVENFNSLEKQLLSGNTGDMLKELKESDERAFNIIVDDYLPTLAKVDKDAYFHVVGNLNKRLIMEMVEEANNTGNDDLKQAALLVNQFVFGSAKFTPPTLRVEKKSEEKDSEVENERLEFVRERFESARDDLQTRVDNTLRATISTYIDPKNVMSSYVKKNAVADAMRILTESIGGESSSTKNLDKLWRAAFDNKFAKDSLGRIQSFYLSRAKANLKNAILKARAEALKDTSPKREIEEDEEEKTPVRRNITPGRPSQPRGRNEMKKGESVTDFFMRD